MKTIMLSLVILSMTGYNSTLKQKYWAGMELATGEIYTYVSSDTVGVEILGDTLLFPMQITNEQSTRK